MTSRQHKKEKKDKRNDIRDKLYVNELLSPFLFLKKTLSQYIFIQRENMEKKCEHDHPDSSEYINNMRSTISKTVQQI